MHDTSVRKQFYPSRLTPKDLMELARLSSAAIHECDEAGRRRHFWQWVFESVVRECATRTKNHQAAEDGLSPAEPEPLEMPLWTGPALGEALLQSHSLIYLNLSPTFAKFADWACLMLVCAATTELKKTEETKNA